MKRLSFSLLALVFFPLAVFAFEVPPNDGFITDTVPLLDPAQDTGLEEMLQIYKQQSSNEIAVLIIRSLEEEEIADIAVEVGRKWGIGTKESNNGILMIVAYEDRRMFIATGYGLEGAVPDIVAAGIVEKDIAPLFRDGDYYGGIRAGIEAIQKHIGGEYTAERYSTGSGDVSGFGQFLFFLFFIGFDFLVAIFGRSKSWWLGGVVGALIGIVLSLMYVWWWSIPVLAGIGLLFDYLVSKGGGGRHRRGPGIWLGGPRGGGGGGFGGFSGGSFGGGGGGGKW
ncbi:MAG: hypothetical protein Greene101449_384 [Candidatus Peregrinibacteria bacterium Greene1014_49]|nr:MAG: hypothetical protein Greene101449_384 [Candidatus Peregrinibacteria bacterium Greene1014_49]